MLAVLMDVAPSAEGFGGALNQALQNAFAKAFEPLAAIIISTIIIAPPVASMALLWAGGRWPFVERTIWISVPAAAVATAASAIGAVFVFLYSARLAPSLDAYYGALPYFAMLVVIVAIGLHIGARATFSWGRAAGIAAAILTPVIYLWLFN